MATYTKPEGMDDWEFYRIEYGGHAMDCVYEGAIWLPPWVYPDKVEQLLGEEYRDEQEEVG
jgi:hypothetical protein